MLLLFKKEKNVNNLVTQMKTNDLIVSVVGRVSFVSVVKRVSFVSIVGRVSVVLNVPNNRNIANNRNFSNGEALNPLNKMNKFYSFVFLVLLSACSTTVTRNDASIGFNKEKHDFGTIAYKKEAACTFEFSNTGKSVLIIYDVKTSCGCTVPEWTKEPILPGKKGLLKIKYDAAFPGVFRKTIDVTYNGSGSPVSLEINGA